MPHLYRTVDGIERRPSTPVPLQLSDGRAVEAVWAGSATEEKLDWWLRKAGHQIAQSEPVAAVAAKADDNGETIWGDAPHGTQLIFIIQPPPPGKNYQLAKMVTTAANRAQVDYFRHHRFALFGALQPGGSIKRVAPVVPPPPNPPDQGELF